MGLKRGVKKPDLSYVKLLNELLIDIDIVDKLKGINYNDLNVAIASSLKSIGSLTNMTR